MLNIHRILGLISLSTCLILSDSKLIRAQDASSSVSRMPITKQIGTYTVTLRSCDWSQDYIVCKFSFMNNTRHPKYQPVIRETDGIKFLPSDNTSTLDSEIDNIKFDGFLELERLKTYELTRRTRSRAQDNTTKVSLELKLLQDDGNYANFVFLNVPLSSIGTNAGRSEPTTEVNVSSRDICPNSENQIIKAETRNFELYICGSDKPTHYIGRAKNNGNSITLPVSSQNPSKFIAKNANVRYTLTPEFLIVTEDGRTILKESVSNWAEAQR